MDFVLFDLPQPKRIELNNAFREHDIPTTVIEQVDIDVNRLEP